MVYVADDGILFAYDPTRGKNLSVQRTNLIVLNSSGPSQGNDGFWFRQAVRGSATGETGYPIARNATITAITAMCRQVDTGDMEIKFTKNDDDAGTDLIRLQFAQTGADASPTVISGSLNIDLDQGDFVQAIGKDNGSGGYLNNTVIMVEIAWRDS